MFPLRELNKAAPLEPLEVGKCSKEEFGTVTKRESGSYTDKY